VGAGTGIPESGDAIIAGEGGREEGGKGVITALLQEEGEGRGNTKKVLRMNEMGLNTVGKVVAGRSRIEGGDGENAQEEQGRKGGFVWKKKKRTAPVESKEECAGQKGGGRKKHLNSEERSGVKKEGEPIMKGKTAADYRKRGQVAGKTRNKVREEKSGGVARGGKETSAWVLKERKTGKKKTFRDKGWGRRRKKAHQGRT